MSLWKKLLRKGQTEPPAPEEDVEADAHPSRTREYIEAFAIAIVLALFIRAYIMQAYKIPSGSMLETLQIGDHLLANKFLYGVTLPFGDKRILEVRAPRRGDIIVFKYPEDETKNFIKRIIGEPGDTIEIINKQVFLNGERYDLPAAQHKDSTIYPAELNPRDNMGKVTVPPDSYFMMGDNRDHSLDSRYWGFVHRDKIMGKAVVIYWSWGGEHWVRLGRIGNLIR